MGLIYAISCQVFVFALVIVAMVNVNFSVFIDMINFSFKLPDIDNLFLDFGYFYSPNFWLFMQNIIFIMFLIYDFIYALFKLVNFKVSKDETITNDEIATSSNMDQ